jgi:hypothetical protein
MRADIDLREIDLSKLRLSRRTWIVLVIVLLAATGVFLAWRSLTNPPRPWLVRWKLDRYLAEQARTADFKVSFPFPSKEEMARSQKSNEAGKGPVRGSRTGRDFETLREEYLTQKTAMLVLQREIVRSETNLKDAKSKLDASTKQATESQTGNVPSAVSQLQSNIMVLREQIAPWEKSASRRPELQEKENALAPIVDDLWEFQRAWIADSGSGTDASGSLVSARMQLLTEAQKKMNGSSYEAMYQSIGQELFVAKRLLASGNQEHRREGVSIALAAARHALNYAMNGYVAARICDGYILPNLDLATDRNARSAFNEENLLGQCADIFRRNEERNNVVRVYELYQKSAKNPARADWARSQIAMAYDQAGDPKRALAAWREIKDTNSFRFLSRRVQRWEQDAKAQ